jgi:hypothetical protein
VKGGQPGPRPQFAEALLPGLGWAASYAAIAALPAPCETIVRHGAVLHLLFRACLGNSLSAPAEPALS